MPTKNPNPRPWAIALQNLCLTVLKNRGGRGTARDVSLATGKALELITPRFTELVELGAIRDTGGREGGGKGRPRVVWEVCDVAAQHAARAEVVTEKFRNEPADEPAWFKKFGQ